MKSQQLQPIFILLVALSTLQVSCKPASTNNNDYEDYEGRSFEVMSFDDKATGAEDKTFDNSFDYFEYPTLPPLRHQMTNSNPTTSQIASTTESNSTTHSAVPTASQEELVEIDPEFYDDYQPIPSTLTHPTEDSNFEQEDEQIAFESGGFVSLYSTEPPTSTGNSSTRKPRRRLHASNYKTKRPNITSSSPSPSNTSNIEDPLQIQPDAPSLNTRSGLTSLPMITPVNFNLNAPALPSHHADTPHRLVVELARMEQRIQKRFKELQEASDQTNKRISELNTWIRSRDREYLTNKEEMKVEQEKRTTRVRELFRKTSQNFESAMKERATLYRNSESLRRTMNSHKSHHEEELRRLAIGAAQNFGIVQEEVTRLFNMINRLSQIQNGELFPLE